MFKRISHSSDAVAKFLKQQVQLNQGISLQNLMGHLSQLSPELRTKYGSSVKSLRVFLQQYPSMFVISNGTNVSVLTESRQTTSLPNGSVQSSITSTSDLGTNERDVTCLADVTGTIYRLFSLYGFIRTEYPVRTSVYFDVKSFEDAKHKSLPSSGLRVGECVNFDAKLGPKHCTASFRATRVTRSSMSKPSSSPGLPLSSANDIAGGDCDTVTKLVNQQGVIETVKSKYGFIKFGLNMKERAFFHAKNVEMSLSKSTRNLPDVLTIEDDVRFNAMLSKKPTDKVKWEATAVYLCRHSDSNGAADFENDPGNEIFMSDDGSDSQDLPVTPDPCESRKTYFNGSAGCATWDATSAKADSCNTIVKKERNAMLLSSGGECRQKLSGERGFLYPITESSGIVKFGSGRGLMACAAVDVTYRDQGLIDNFLWEVADGQEVSFDAMQADDNTWVATLVWIGQRPTKPLVADRKVVFNRKTNKGWCAQKQFEKTEQSPSVTAGGKDTLQNVDTGSQSNQPLIAVYKDVKGIIAQVMECIGICEVQEFAVSRKIEFTSECFYKDGTMFLGYLNEVLCEGDTVFLDYMVGVNGAKEEACCGLIWQGRRPEGVRQTSHLEFGQGLQITTQGGENSLGFKVFKTEIKQADDETSRGPSRVPSDTGLQEDTVPSTGIRWSGSVSVAGLLATPSAETSIATYMRSPRPHDGIPTRRSSPEVPIVSAAVYDEVLLRAAKTVAAEFIAEEKRRVVLHDVGVLTVDEDALPSQYSGPDGLSPAIVSTSTQTVSTGGVNSERLFIT
ncbi:hypothetical protein HPB48_015606 [Haemaphysalis longicornis]|uniref:Egal-1 winged helix domain-containing protein n=1 Tax=Haemaphysalis longicornis TaxID=44386 RepID=A0A9J6FJ94_HAELO|nr:hypothetical protein HPB48_015606 [Haemaphysalis longicornis]